MKSKQTATITFHASHNCGSFMQAYALQQFLRQNKYKNEIIDFSNDGQRNFYKPFFQNNSIKNIIKNIILLPHRRILSQTFTNYENFIKSNLVLSKQSFHNNAELKKQDFCYDTYISGSDQIWNITIEDSDTAYFLDFINSEQACKIAYAPSFGAKRIANFVDSAQLQHYKKMLSTYDFLSIREKNGQKWIKEMINSEVPIVLDPTLLLNRSDYEKLERPYEGIPHHPYIFYYAPSYDRRINSLVKKIAKKYKLKVVVWNPRNYYLKGMNLSNFILPPRQNPGVYLSLIRDAEMVITTSFHGTIFSTIYNKNFWTIKNGEMFNDDDRVKTLIEQLHISDRLIPATFNQEFDYSLQPNYAIRNKKLPELQKKSINFLMEALGNGK